MKVRIKGSSIRMRVTRSEIAKLVVDGSVEEVIYFSAEESSKFVYAIRHAAGLVTPTLQFNPPSVVIELPSADAKRWAEGGETGIYAEVDLGARGVLYLIVEKDFACLDLSDAENADAFPNPNVGAACQ